MVVNKYATLKEIKDEYTVEDVLDLYEMCLTNISNKARLMERGQRSGRI